MSNSLDPDQGQQHVVGPDLGPNCLQRLSADDTSKQRVKVGVVFRSVNYEVVYLYLQPLFSLFSLSVLVTTVSFSLR